MKERASIRPRIDIGDILLLPEPLPGAPAGLYVLLSVGVICCLAAARRTEEGSWRSTLQLADVSITDLSEFRPLGAQVDALD